MYVLGKGRKFQGSFKKNGLLRKGIKPETVTAFCRLMLFSVMI